MRAVLLALSAFLLILLPTASAQPKKTAPVPVRVEKTDEGFRLLRDGKPFLVKGVGGHTNLALLAACGGNSIRTWDTKGLGEILDEAHKNGLTVLAGIWLGHERHGFNYNDSDQVSRQYEEAK